MRTLIFTIFSLILIATSCIAGKPKTPVVKETRDLSGFNEIYTNSSIDVYIKQGDKESVVVETNKEFLEQVITTVDDNKLNISVKGNIINPERFNIYITVIDLKSISSSGSGDIESQGTLKFPELLLKNKGSGDIEMTLESKLITLENKGSGDVDLKGKIEELNINSFGSGDIEIENIDFVKCLVNTSGSGDIEISGSADLFNFDNKGSGDLEGENFKVKELNANSGGSGDIKIAVEKVANVNLGGSGNCKIIGNPTNKNLKSSGSGDFY